MRSLMAVVTPQQLVNDTILAVEHTTGNRTKEGVQGAELCGYGFVVSPQQYARHGGAFAARLNYPHEIHLQDGGRAVVGVQFALTEERISWFWGQTLPQLALVCDPTLNLPDGGGFVVVRVNDLDTDSSALNLRDAPSHETTLMGRRALRVDLTTPPFGVGEGVHALYVVDHEIIDIPSELPRRLLP